MSRQSIAVFDGTTRAGTVDYDPLEERFSFAYDEIWQRGEQSYSISPHIALDAAPATSATVRRFLENLLPEGRALDVVATTYRVSKNNIYGLIRALGRDTAGALTFLPGDETPVTSDGSLRAISRAELARRIEERAHVPFAVWDGRVRMAIAGYQDKLAVYLDGEGMYLVDGTLASTHILKPEPAESRLPMLVANEHFGMSLAGRLGLAVAKVSILRTPTPILLVARFDRERSSGGVLRRHIIDACQALDLPVSYKYERIFGSGRDVRHIRDGVSFERLFSLSRYTVRKAVTRLALLRWALFQFLLGNADAHGKNISFFCHRQHIELTPFYDLVSAVQYEGLDDELAMGYGDAFRLEQIRAYDWVDFARRTGTPRTLLAREMRRMGTAAHSAAAAQAGQPDYVGAEKDLVAQIAAFVREQGNKLADMASAMLKVQID